MKRLLLMRHAKSSWKQPVADAMRHLNERGTRAARAVALELELMDLEPDLVLASNATRCRETWGEMTRRTRWMNEKRVKDVKYLSEFYGIFDRPATEQIFLSVQEHAREDHESVLCLGHNMGWELALDELVGPRGRRSCGSPLEMNTADLFVLECALDSWDDVFLSRGRWAVRQTIRSRELIGEEKR
mmetsp:Transcript_382/g.1408  ORF Transcript_382/g.1408 Transcript_382/m.1408 type:complete len:187 (+) Transcript_382:322-882(+)